MGNTITLHGTGPRNVTVNGATSAGGLAIEIDSHGDAGADTLYLYLDHEGFAAVLIELSTWPEVVAAAGEAWREAIIGANATATTPELDPIARDHFARALSRYGLTMVLDGIRTGEGG